MIEFLFLRNGEQVAKSFAFDLSRKVSLQVANHLEAYLEPPQLINQINQGAIAAGLVDPQNPEELGRWFWQQIQQFNVSYVNFGTPGGELVGAERKPDGSFGLDLMIGPDSGTLKEYQADAQGNPVKVLQRYPYDHRREAWYQDAVEAGQPVWSEIYQWDGRPGILAISASLPLYDANQALVGVFGVDQTLTDLSRFLRQVPEIQGGVVFIIEPSGLLVASSGEGSIFQPMSQPMSQPASQSTPEEFQRIQATASSDPLIREAANFLQQNDSNQNANRSSPDLANQMTGFRVDQRDYFIQVLPWQDQLGLDWQIVVVLPESQFMGVVYDQLRKATLLSLLALGIAIYLGILISRWITRPIQRLNQTTQAIASACSAAEITQQADLESLIEWDLQSSAPKLAIQELDSLSRSFHQMAQRLLETFNQLEQVNQTLELRVEQRNLQLQLSETKFEKAFRNSPIISMIISFEEQRLIDVNQSFIQIFGYEKDQVIGEKFGELNICLEPERWRQLFEQFKTDRSALNREFQFQTQFGQPLAIEFLGEMIALNEQNCILLTGLDITLRKQAEIEKEMNQYHLQLQQMVMMELSKYSEIYQGNLENALQKITQLAAHTLDVEQVSIWLYNIDHSQVNCSDLYCLTTRSHSSGTTQTIAEYPLYFQRLEENSAVFGVDARTHEYNADCLALSLNRSNYSFPPFAILDIPISSGEITLGILHLEHLNSARIWKLEEQNFAAYLAHMISLAMEAYDHTETEIALRQNEELFRQLTENIESVLWMSDPQLQRMVYVSPAYESIWGRPRRELYRSPQAFLETIHPDDQDIVMIYLERRLQDKCETKYRIVKPDGEIRWIYDQAFPVKDEDGRVYRVSGISADITDRKRSEEQIQSALQEKEILLKEIHHRVKNNLHIVSNLLDLQSDSIEDEHLLHLFEESQNRIRSMALVHEQLYQSDNLGQVNFGDYIHRLVENIFFSLEEAGTIEPIIQVESIQLNLETAIPCGLIINELVTNSFKHAFPNRQSGKVQIELYQDDQQKIHLTIRDNGVGIPAELNWENSPSLGLKLVKILSKQLRAAIHFDTTSGTVVSLTFSQLRYKPRY
ncbi:MAG: PAS domain S-box protein [Oscillatoriales cyanobacterium RM2_1_1]|nr:PAS domain S-box protein [Oscillatoriales cyanobacterium RM2_1_1]